MAVVRFHSAEAWLITASICSCRLLLGAVRLRFTWEFLSVMVSMTPGGGDCFVDAPLFLFARNLADLQILSKNLQYCVPACPTLRGSLLQRHQREFSSSLCRRFVVPNPVGERFNCPHCSGLLELFAAFPPLSLLSTCPVMRNVLGNGRLMAMFFYRPSLESLHSCTMREPSTASFDGHHHFSLGISRS
jgi:hypothetical protein